MGQIECAQTNVLVFSSLGAERMARREWQDPSVLTRDSAAGPEWYIRYRVKVLEDSKIRRIEKWHTLGLCAKLTKRQAEREADKIMRDINAQVFTVQSQITWPTFVMLFDQNHIARLKTPTQANYRQQLRTHVTPVWGKMRLCDIGPLQVDQLFSLLEVSGVARSTRNTIRGVLGAAFKCARKWKLTDATPMAGANIGGGPKRIRECRVPLISDIQRLMAECEGDVPLLIEALYTTGMRISEAAGLTVGDLDFETGFAHVTKRNCRGDLDGTKSDAGTRDLPMGGILDALRSHVAGRGSDDLVFTWHGEAIVDNTLLANYLTPRMKKLGIKFPGFGWHTFRRLHISLMDKRGLTIFELRQQAGHADIRTTQRYVVDDAQARQKAVLELPRIGSSRKKTA
jgi:integrase